jgi:hypothetical protein
VNPETTEELLSRMEREHVPCPGKGSAEPHNEHCMEDWGAPWPCDVARLVAHIRSLEAAHDALCGTMQAMWTHLDESHCLGCKTCAGRVSTELERHGEVGAALGEAQ